MKNKTCVKCGSDKCIGFYLLHSAEMNKISKLKERELKEDSNTTFKLIRSTDRNGMPDGLFTKFIELHILKGE